ncbi:MAG: hypothetical protein Q7R33_04395 [Nitrosarchaeum sp.]|nr:hypothetical protein [Nitrosarchaeum sp.]
MIIHPAVKREHIGSFTYSTGETANGHVVEFTCASENVDKVKELLKFVRSIERPITHKVNVEHGGYGKYTRFNIDQHKYAGGHGGYIEVLEIKNPPDNRHGIVIHSYSSREGQARFTEFDTLENAMSAWTNHMNDIWDKKDDKKIPGFIRHVECGWFEPWFYATGDQFLTGDFVYPDAFAQHPLYQVGKQFIVNEDGYNEIKTCMGAIEEEKETDSWTSGRQKYKVTTIYWSDGTTSKSAADSAPKPIQHNSWITEAILKFSQIITGKINRFEIPFTNGTKFVGQLSYTTKSLNGIYRVHVLIKKDGKEKKVKADRLKFTATDVCKTVRQKLELDCLTSGAELLKIISCVKVGNDNTKTWKTIFDETEKC